MSFTMDVKNELCLIKYESKCCKRAHLAGIVGFCGTTAWEEGTKIVKIRTESTAIARRAYALIKEVLGVKATLTATGKICAISVTQGAENLLKELGFWENGVEKFTINPFVCHDDCCKTAFLAGAFLGGGYVKTPKNGYHFEIKNHYRTLTRELSELIEEMGFAPKFVMRKSEYVTYLKQSDAICDILMQMGATDAMLELCNMKILKDVRNNITRKVNCDTANITKTADAAALQLRAIEKVKAKMGLSALPKPLEEAARLRLENPAASLTELGELISPPISKSGVNHRLKKIIKLANDLPDA